MKKPDVLSENPFNSNSDEQFERLCWSVYEQGKNDQNTADRAYHEPLIKELLDKQASLMLSLHAVDDAIQQAKQETAREIFDAYDKYLDIIGKDISSMMGLLVSHGWSSKLVKEGEQCQTNIEELKSKYLSKRE